MTLEIQAGIRNNEIKGVLILCIVVGHSAFVKFLSHDFVSYLYYWHVQTFFLLIALRGRKLAGGTARRDTDWLGLCVRYMVPYLWFAGCIGLLRALSTGDPAALGQFLMGLVMGNSDGLDAYSGGVYWFVPTFVWTLLGWSLLSRTLRSWSAVLAAAVLGTLFTILVPVEVLREVPLGLGLVPYFLTTLLIFDNLARLLRVSEQAHIILLGLFAAATLMVVFLVLTNNTVNIGYFRLGSFPVSLLVALTYPALILSAMIVMTNRLGPLPWLAFVGRASFGIFLMHQLVLFPGTLLARKLGFGTPVGAVVALLVIGAAVIIPILIERAIFPRPRLKRILFPKDHRELLGTESSV